MPKTTLTERRDTRISKTTAKRLKRAADRVDRSEAAVIRRALERYLDEVDVGGRASEEIGEGLPVEALP